MSSGRCRKDYRKLKEAQVKNKARFNKVKELQPRKIQKGNWVVALDSRLENQYNTMRKFAKWWFGPCKKKNKDFQEKREHQTECIRALG